MHVRDLTKKLNETGSLSKEEYVFLLENSTPEDDLYLFELAREAKEKYYGKEVYVRGLIEFTNYCHNDCYYCGIRKSNAKVERYRLTEKEILECCHEGYELGYRTFVLQGGEDSFFTKEKIGNLIQQIKQEISECAITLSLGERNIDEYKYWFECGAERYLLRHETASEEHYNKLHPQTMHLANRKECLYQLRDIGYQVGAGFMVGSPYQTMENLAEDLLFLKQLQPHMIGIGPFLSQSDTPFAMMENGSLALTLRLLAMIRLMMPRVLLPATTALGTLHPQGREMGLKAGANVVMPNLSPTSVREKYLLYDNKICTGDAAAHCKGCMAGRVASTGYNMAVAVGNSLVE